MVHSTVLTFLSAFGLTAAAQQQTRSGDDA
jgi:pimeloyl-ACP methyl ester carboxylesterase